MVFLSSLMLLAGSFLYWRQRWFFRNPPRKTPQTAGIVSPADGTVVYARQVEPEDDVIVIKRGFSATITDIVKEDLAIPKIVIGIFMSPFDVHYNRAPLSGIIEFIRHYPARQKNLNMGPMHLRTLLHWPPFYKNSLHILQNERTVTKMNCSYKENQLSCYLVQIGGRTVNRVVSYFKEGDRVELGTIFGMIRMGSQVDIIVPSLKGMKLQVRPGDRVRAGETILII